MGPITRARCSPQAGNEPVLRRALESGLAAGTLAAVFAGWRATSEGSAMLAPINAVTHCIWPRRAFRETGFSPRFTLTGLAIHHASAVFWALLFEAVNARLARGTSRTTPLATATAAAATAATAYIVDYHVVPERLTPGFDIHLSNRSLAGVYVALAAGFAVAALLRSPLQGDRS
ncbi:hypothetical protein PPMP20_29740 [Paraburkholderia phymatum]|uniref:DUF1440 domain-containing protein n=1 Tax=Paraburkholderia phymatum (strain DSM 17167 / CIP 108236 / LMG 21445 / STM815) TaxID=391038 RepID=B2JRV9_PARP8|nr:hypothetical protein [Paraburkholderia phymatum]ACC73878.1 conserved hypothetical protein [Paraburkholderia phymatum STM815]